MGKKINVLYKIIPDSFRSSQLFWNFISKIAPIVPDKKFQRIPNEIIIEPGNNCNLRCPVCPTHFAMKRKRGLMKLELFKSIIDDMKELKKKPLISMNFAGEPLLNRNIPEFVRYAVENGHKTFISTNVTMLSENMAKDLILAGLNSIHLCIDGFKKESHEAYRIGSDFNIVKRNIENFMNIKKTLKAKNPHVSIQTLLTSFSEQEIEDLTNWARKIGADEINFKSLSMGSYTSESMKKKYSYLLPRNEKFLRKTTNVYKTVCPAVLSHVVIYWDGDLGLCCIDFDKKLKMSNIHDMGFIKTFLLSDTIKKRRLGFLKKHPICKNCSIGNADSIGFRIDLKNNKE